MLSVRNVLQLFALDGDLGGAWSLAADPALTPWVGDCYIALSIAIAVAAPVMTAGFVLSFFKDASALLRYHSPFNRRANLYLISELNERSIALARDILAGRGALHTAWASGEEARIRAEADFNRFEYFRRSSMSQAFYEKLREEIGIREYAENTADPAERAHNEVLKQYEHMRWNAYMRSEGYVSVEGRENRSDIAKTHYDLVAYERLSDAERRKDLIRRGDSPENSKPKENGNEIQNHD